MILSYTESIDSIGTVYPNIILEIIISLIYSRRRKVPYSMSVNNDERTSKNSIDSEELEKEYESQSLPTVMRINYKGPTSREDSWESKKHIGGPSCYECCTSRCAVALVVALTAFTVCCAYVSPNGECCSICYWPF